MIELLLLMALIGVVAWAIVTYVPMPQPIKTVIIIAAAIFCILLLARAFGIDGFDGIPNRDIIR
jgi:hypothetical protein